MISDNVVGGFFLVFNRRLLSTETKIQNVQYDIHLKKFFVDLTKNEVCDIIAGFDLNEMCLHCFAEAMPRKKLF